MADPVLQQQFWNEWNSSTREQTSMKYPSGKPRSSEAGWNPLAEGISIS